MMVYKLERMEIQMEKEKELKKSSVMTNLVSFALLSAAFLVMWVAVVYAVDSILSIVRRRFLGDGYVELKPM